MHQHPALLLEDDAYLQVMVTYNEALGHCLACVIENAKDYDAACQRLLDGDWPENAPEIAKQYLSQFPELTMLFPVRDVSKQSTAKQPLPKGRLWEEVRNDLFNHPEYQQFVRIRSAPFRQQMILRGMKILDLYIECLPRVLRQVIGRAVVWPVTLGEYRASHPGTTTTWLQFALNWSRKEVVRAIRENLGLPVRDPGTQVGDQPMTIKPVGDLPEGLTDEMEARELPAPDDAEAREHQRILREALARLPAGERRVIELKWEEEKTIDEIAEEMGLPLSDVKKILRRALDSLRRQLGDYFGPK